MVPNLDLDKATSRSQIRVDGNVAAEVVTMANREFAVWFQDPFYGYQGRDWFSMGETILRKLPTNVDDIYVKTTDNRGYYYKREDLETGVRIDPFDSFFNERPPESQYAAPIEDARDTFRWPDQKNTFW